MKFSYKGQQSNKFLTLVLYFLNRWKHKNLAKNHPSMAGYSFDAIHSQINLFGAYEREEILVLEQFLKDNLKDPAIALDVGANIGNHTVNLFARMFNTVHCFEPHPKIFQLLRLNTEDLQGVTIHNFGLSNAAAELEIQTNMSNWGSSSMSIDRAEEEPEIGTISKASVKRLDDEDLGLAGKIDFVKVDIEGHEIEFLKGAEQTLSRDKPIIVFEEGNIRADGTSEVSRFLADLGYEFFTLKENFDLGEGKIKKILRSLLQDIFGTTFTVEKVEKLEQRFHYMVIAKPKDAA